MRTSTLASVLGDLVGALGAKYGPGQPSYSNSQPCSPKLGWCFLRGLLEWVWVCENWSTLKFKNPTSLKKFLKSVVVVVGAVDM
jgi:hypothetical protein